MAKKAVLIGINYSGTKAELRGCVNDVKRMHKCLLDRFGFSENDIKVLIDTDETYTKPTGANIRSEIDKLVESGEAGDALFIHYSGHGTRLPVEHGEEDNTGFDECIVPCDMNLITDDDMKDFVVRVPNGCRLTIVSDSCHSGGLIGQGKEQIGESTKNSPTAAATTIGNAIREIDINNDLQEEKEKILTPAVANRSLPIHTLIHMLKQKFGKNDIAVGNIRPTLFDTFGEDTSPKVKKFAKLLKQKVQSPRLASMMNVTMEFVKANLGSANGCGRDDHEKNISTKSAPENGILVSACQSDQKSEDFGSGKEVYGALSNAIQSILRDTKGSISNRELVTMARKKLARQGFEQKPGLYCTDSNVDAPFIC